MEFGNSDVWATDRSVSVHSGGREKFPEWSVQVSFDCTQTTLSCSNDLLLTSSHYSRSLFKLPVITVVVMSASFKSFPRMKWALAVFLSDASCAVNLLSPLLSALWLRIFCGSYWLKTLIRDWALGLEEQKRSSLIHSSRFLQSFFYFVFVSVWSFSLCSILHALSGYFEQEQLHQMK